MSHECPTPRVYDPDSGVMPQSSIGFKLVDGVMIEMCADCGSVAPVSAEQAAAIDTFLESEVKAALLRRVQG